ncbi:major facilitator superfamily domain-containing protein [Lasiosphaeris hirsuta]|uniref:Major facilitator superfamily domain-containing protein n=1 Tax=Lasiosphaeris hirsuta TaxID=260670 RepID=A0AA40B8I0_9PEZI|nr:major facilitator superfamily domain-containing protein [Lasiosphaeris hirsuta]
MTKNASQPQSTETDSQTRFTEDGHPVHASGDHAPDLAGIRASDAKEGKHRDTPQEKAEKKRMRNYRLKIVFGLMAPFTLQALDTTIIASALPFIAADFNEISQLNWIITSFNLTAAAFLPFWSQAADIFGRHATLHASVLTMAIGSALCTAAPTSAFGVLLLGRALQGVGTAGVNISVRTILADRVSLAEYSKNWTVFALVSAVGFSVGPVAGGYLTQVSWRWCFAINLPVAVLAVVLVVVLLRGELLGPQPLPQVEGTLREGRVRDRTTRRGRFLVRLATVDYGGQLLFLWGLGLLVLAFTWAGGTYAWDSPAVLAPMVVGAILTGAWLLYEYCMAPGRVMARVFPLQRPMMPWQLLAQKDIGLLLVINFTVGVAMFAVMYFMDLYFALVQGKSASSAGLALLYFLPGLGVGSFSTIFFSNVWPRQTQPCLLLGTTCSAVGITVLAWATNAENVPTIYGMMALVGFGVGATLNPSAMHALAFFPTLTAPISCLVAFANPFGGTVGLTLMSTVFNNKSGSNHSDPQSAKNGIMWAFIALVPIMWTSVLVTMFLGNVWILPGREGGHEVVSGAWMWSFVTRQKLVRHKVAREDGFGARAGGLLLQPLSDANKVSPAETQPQGQGNGAELA